ncbi:MAG: histidinol-phosphate aminotransferase [Micromonosporaceae bacterium]
MPLALSSYAGLSTLGDDPELLNLAWTLDERHHLSVDVLAVVAAALRAEVTDGLPSVRSYLVQDPYGEEILGPAATGPLGAAGPVAITCGAGVGPLLADLVRLAGGAPLYIAGDVYPDLPHWAQRAGSHCVTYADRMPQIRAAEVTVAMHAENALALGAVLVALEHPALSPDLFIDAAAVGELCDRLAGHGVPVIVDESNANYWPPEFSCARLVASTPNLVVVRGLSKAYGLGGLRLGYCLSRPETASVLRGVIPPLLASSMSLALGSTVLSLGDVTGPLRERIRRHRAEVAGLMREADVGTPVAASEFLPYLLFGERPEQTRAALHGLGVLAKLQPVWSAEARAPQTVCRMSVPLDDGRMDRLRTLVRRR